MSISALEQYLSPEVRRDLVKWIRALQCFIVFLIILPVLLPIASLMIFCRLLITVYFKVVHHGKYSLCSPVDSAFAYESRANCITITTFCFVKGKLNADLLRERVHKSITEYESENGHKPHEKLTWKLSQKFGFFAWDTRNSSFKIEDHVKQCPGIDPDAVYSEEEVQKIGEKFIDETMPLNPNLPLWEVLYIPKVCLTSKDKDAEETTHFALIFRLHHAYMDGISFFQVFSKAIFDEPRKLVFDPTRSPWNLSTLEKFGLYAQAFFMAPYTIFSMYACIAEPKHVFNSITENGPKYYKCTSKEITLDSVKSIRNQFKCSTISVFTSTMTGALRRAALRKNLDVPEQLNFAITAAVLPYPNEEPQNRFTVKLLQTPMTIADPAQRLRAINSIMKSVKPHEILALYTLCNYTGIFPAKCIGFIYSFINCGFTMSNVPGFKNALRISDAEVEKIYGAPPLQNGVGFSVGFSSYNGRIHAACIVEKSEIISSREDMDALLGDIDREFADLECIANGNQNDVLYEKKQQKMKLY